MTSTPQWLEPAHRAFAAAKDRGMLVFTTAPLSDEAIDALASAAGMEAVTVDARVHGLFADGVVRAALRDELGGIGGVPDASFALDALGGGDAARRTWSDLHAAWTASEDPEPPLEFDLDDSLDEPVEAVRPAGIDPDRRVEALARLLVAAGDLAPRLVVLRHPTSADATSLAAVRSALASGRGAGTAWVIEGPIDDTSPIARILSPVDRAASDERFDGPRVARVTPPSHEADSPRPPGRGTAAELLAMLQTAGCALPEELLSSEALSTHRGQAPRASFQDLEGLLHTERARIDAGWIVVDRHGVPEPGPLTRADARALGDALGDIGGGEETPAVRAALALAGEVSWAADEAADAGRALLARGDLLGARRWLDRAASWLRGALPPEIALLRARVAARLSDTRTATRIAREALLAGVDDARVEAELHLEAGRIALIEGDDKVAQEHLGSAAEIAKDVDALDIAGEAHLALAALHDQHGRYRESAAAAADAAKAFGAMGDQLSAARAFAARAVAIAGAGQPPRALQELKHAMKRTPDPDDPRPGALDVRIAMGQIFRDAGDRDKARQALALASKRAHAHCLADREATARLGLARFYLEAIPVRGAERGEALSGGREAAEAAIQLARGAGRPDLEAEAEALLGELAWRGEDWSGASEALDRELALWTQAGNVGRIVDVALRRGQVAARQEDWDAAFASANTALTQAQRKRLNARLAHAHVQRAEALQHLDRKDEALNSLQEAQRLFGSLGEEYAAQAGAAERRARQLVAG